jgi:ribosome-associated translation inhibitor RaiA
MFIFKNFNNQFMNIQLVGFDKFSIEIRDQVNKICNRLLDKYKKIFDEKSVKVFKLSVDKLRERGDHTLFEIKCYLETTHGLFYAVHSDWKVLDAVERVEEEMLRQIVEKKEKLKGGKK